MDFFFLPLLQNQELFCDNSILGCLKSAHWKMLCGTKSREFTKEEIIAIPDSLFTKIVSGEFL